MAWTVRRYLPVLANSARTAVATVVSFWVASLFRMPEAYWAPITTVVIMQSTLGASWKVSVARLVGTVLGALMGAGLLTYFPGNLLMFGLGVLLLGIACALLRVDNAFRFAAITLAVVALISRTGAGPRIAFHRFVEVSIGIVVGLLVTSVWPEVADLQAAVAESEHEVESHHV